MGSPLKMAGVINADVSTCIAGWLNRMPDTIPVRTTVKRDRGLNTKTFNVRVARLRPLTTSLVFSVLTNSVDMEGDLPEEMTAELTARIEVEGHDPIVIRDTFSGASYSGGRAPSAIFSQVAAVVNLLTFNAFQAVRINKIECETTISPGRRSADIEAVELDSDTYAPGDTLQATVFVRPYKGLVQRIPVDLKLPADLPEGRHTALVCDDLLNARQSLRDNPLLSNPQSLEQVFQALTAQTTVKRTSLVVRLPISSTGIALKGKALPSLPASMVQILGSGRRTGAQTVSAALVARHSTPWVISGSETLRFTVAKDKKTRVRE
jgi:hypothetical protein